MNGYLAFFLTVLIGVIVAAAGEFLSEEVRDRLDQVPRAILHLAARWLEPGQRVTVYREEWEPELEYILKGKEARPVTRLVTGTWYALGILISTRRIARHLHRPEPGQPDAATARTTAATTRYRPFRLPRGQFLVTLAGAQADVLGLCPTERVKFQSLGSALLVTSAMAAVSMWFAVSSVLGVNAIVAVAPALLWGFVIMGIDRWLVTSIPVDSNRKFVMAIPRLILAVLLGTVISVPLVLRVFQPEINAEITMMSNQQAAAVSNLRAVIGSRGAVAITLPADPQVRSLTEQLDTESSLQQGSYQLWQCLLHGGPGCPARSGPLATAAEAVYNHVRHEASVLGSELRQARYQQAVAELPAAVNHEDASRAAAATPDMSGLMVRLQALSNLSQGNDTIAIARALLLLLFLTIGCLTLTVKLLQRPGHYEAALLMARSAEIRDLSAYYYWKPLWRPTYSQDQQTQRDPESDDG